MMMTMTVKVRMFAHTPHLSVRLELIKIWRKTREKQANLTKTRFWTQLVIAPSLDALSTDALVERVHPARGSVGHGGREEIVGWGVLHLDNDDGGDCIEKEEDGEDWLLKWVLYPAVELALVLLRDPAILGHPFNSLGRFQDLELVDDEADGYDDEKGDKVDDALGRSSILKLLPLKARHCSSL